MLYILFIMLFL